MNYFKSIAFPTWKQCIYILEPLGYFLYIWLIYRTARALVTSIKLKDKKRKYNHYATYSIYLMAIVGSFLIAGTLSQNTYGLYFLRGFIPAIIASFWGVADGLKRAKKTTEKEMYDYEKKGG